jgi:hypothetical protein
METQIAIVQIKSILRKIIGLLDEVKVTVLHSTGKAAGER